MPDGLVRRHRAGSDWCRSARYWRLRASRSVCRCLKPLSLGLSLIKADHDALRAPGSAPIPRRPGRAPYARTKD